MNVAGLCSGFNFRGTDQQKKVGFLSGGERTACISPRCSSRRQCAAARRTDERSRRRYAAGAGRSAGRFRRLRVVISHDRWFLDRIATHILAFEGDSHVEWFEGNFQDYEEDKMRRTRGGSVIPHRIKYKKFSR